MAISRDDAYAQYRAAYGGNFDADADADFENYWKNSKDSGLMQGSGYDKSWDQIMGDVQNRVNERFNRSTASNGGVGGDLDPNGTSRAASSGSGNSNTIDGLLAQMFQTQQANEAKNKQRNDEIYDLYLQQAKQSTNIDPNDPTIRAQTDAYRFQEERAKRDYLDALAERSGPYRDLTAERRMGAESVGQRVGAFQAGRMADELTARRNQQSQAIAGLASFLNADQVRELQRQLGILDNNAKAQQAQIALQGLGLDRYKTDVSDDQFWARLGLDAEDQAARWDAIRSGLMT